MLDASKDKIIIFLAPCVFISIPMGLLDLKLLNYLTLALGGEGDSTMTHLLVLCY